jgi:hypothetical protein
MNAEQTNLRVRALVRHGLHRGQEAVLTDEERRLLRRRRIELLIYFCWGLIVIKSFVVTWAVGRYAMPFNPLWVIGPTVSFALIATIVYYCGRD